MFDLAEIQALTGGTLLGDPAKAIDGISTDTRTIREGDLYLALRGERFDGHSFLPSIQGTHAVIFQDGDACAPSIKVEDTLLAYGQLARGWRKKWGGIVVAVTGSSGKTSTKEAIASLLSLYGKTAKTEGNFNNEIGLPKTLLAIEKDARFAVVEMGMRGMGEIRALAKLALPSVGVITNIGKAHLGRLGSQEAIQKAKGELFEVLEKLNGGVAVANGDDPLARALLPKDGVSFGFREGVIRGSWIDARSFAAEGCKVTLVVPGEHHASNALAALAVAKVLGLPLPSEWQPSAELPGRARAKTVGGITLWDETYNANPDSMRAAIKSLFLQPGRKILVLGEMGELGPEEGAEHQALGRFLADYPVHLLVTVGPLAARYGEEAPCPHQNFDSREAAAEALIPHLAPGDAVLFKGSRSTRMEEILERIHGALEGTKGV